MRKFLIMLAMIIGFCVNINAQNDSIYKDTHKWNIIPTKDMSFECSECGKWVYDEDSLECIAVYNDTIYVLGISKKVLPLNTAISEIHKFIRPKNSTYESEDFKRHLKIFDKELRTDTLYFGERMHEFQKRCPTIISRLNFAKKYNDNELFSCEVDLFNATMALVSYNYLYKIAPYGFFDEWHWNDEYSNVSFGFTYTNLNKKTIKYIDVYWKITNDVDDVRTIGHFKGTGPLEYNETASWNWKHSSYYTSGDATRMSMTKVIITYMDNTHVTLIKHIKVDNN